MRNMLKNSLATLLLTLIFITSSFCNDFKTKPSLFPESSINLIAEDLSKNNLLDTAYLLTFDYLEYLKNLPHPEQGLESVKHPDFVKYIDYIYVKGILNSLVEMETNKDPEIRENLLFKLSVQLKNRSLSRQDLIFVYENWDLDEVNEKSGA